MFIYFLFMMFSCCCFWCFCSHFHLLRLRLVGCASNIFPSLWLKSSTLIFRMHTFSSALHVPLEMRRDMNCWIFIRHFRCAYNNVLCNHSSALHGVYVCLYRVYWHPNNNWSGVVGTKKISGSSAHNGTTHFHSFCSFDSSCKQNTRTHTLHYERYA